MQTVYRVFEGTREPHRLAVERTAELLGRGGLALIPTETVYGVAVAVNVFSDAVPQDTSEPLPWPRDPQVTVNGAAVPALGTGYRRIFTLKQRELTQTVAWLVDDAEALDRYGVDIPHEARVLARRCWPGALTIVVKAAPACRPYARRRRHGGTSRFGLARGASAHPRLRQPSCLHQRQYAWHARAASFADVRTVFWRGLIWPSTRARPRAATLRPS